MYLFGHFWNSQLNARLDLVYFPISWDIVFFNSCSIWFTVSCFDPYSSLLSSTLPFFLTITRCISCYSLYRQNLKSDRLILQLGHKHGISYEWRFHFPSDIGVIYPWTWNNFCVSFTTFISGTVLQSLNTI